MEMQTGQSAHASSLYQSFLLNHMNIQDYVCHLRDEETAPESNIGRRQPGGGVMLWATICWGTLCPGTDVDATLTPT